jgi:hypothetical protein
MKKYKVIAMPTSPVEDKIKACLDFLKEKEFEKQHKYTYEPDPFREEWTEEEKYAWQCGWESAMCVAYCNLKFWFPEYFEKETK